MLGVLDLCVVLFFSVVLEFSLIPRAAFEDLSRERTGVVEVDFGPALRVRFFCRGSRDRVKTKTTETRATFAFYDFCTFPPRVARR
jgi:hypothetical protein